MSIPDRPDRFGADLPEMEGAAKRVDDLGTHLSTELYPAILPGVESVVRVNRGLPGFSSMADFFDAAVRAAVDQVAGDFAAQAGSIKHGAATFQATDDGLRAQAARISDGVRPTAGPEVA